MSTISDRLSRLFDAERAVRTLHTELSTEDRGALVAALAKAKDDALALPDAREAELRLVRIAELAGEAEGPAAVDLLVDVLGSDHPEARVVAGEVLEAVAFDRFKEVALGVERALDRLPAGSPALSEVPYLLAEVAEPGCLKLLGKFLHHKDPEAVAAAIEALVELADPSAAPMLAPLVRDTRQVQIDDEGEVGHVSIGALAEEAGELLAELEHHERRGNQGPPPPRQGGGGGNKKPRR